VSIAQPTLVELAVDLSTDKEIRHGFLRFYDTQFAAFRESARVFIEVGIGNPNGSMNLWPRYFPNAEVHGVDSTAFFPPERERLHLHRFHQDDRPAWEALFKDEIKADADIVIDDGSHRMQDQQRTFEIVFPRVRPGGLYVIEDLHTLFPELGFGSYGTEDGKTTVDMLQSWLRRNTFAGYHIPDTGLLDSLVATITLHGCFRSLTAVIRRRGP